MKSFVPCGKIFSSNTTCLGSYAFGSRRARAAFFSKKNAFLPAPFFARHLPVNLPRMTDEPSGGWLRSIFRRQAAETPEPPPTPQPDPPPRAAAGDGPPPPRGSNDVSYFRLQGSQGRTLTLQAGATRLTAEATLDTAHAVIAIIPWEQPHLCLIAAQDVRPFHIPGDTYAGIAISARIMRTTMRGIVRLKQPLGVRRFLALEDDPPDDPADGPMRFDHPGNAIAAVFTLVQVNATEITVQLRALAEEFGAAIAGGLRQTEIVAALRERRARPELAEPILRLLPRDELDDLARRMIDDPALLTALRRMFPTDHYLQEALPALAAWRATRDPVSAGGSTESPGTDEALLLPSVGSTPVPVGLALHALARGHVSPRRGLCLLATARNEGPYLLEWLAYHFSIGFEHAFIYTNDNDDGSDTLLTQLARAGVITLVHNKPGEVINIQEKAYAHALSLLPQILDYRWTAVLDIDEYFVFDTGSFESVTDFIALHEAQPVDALAMCWLIFASRFGEPYEPGLTTERFPWRAADPNHHVKSLFRTRLFLSSQPHYPLRTLDGPTIFRTEDGQVHHHPGVIDRIPAFAAKPSATQAWINHYMFRTAPESLWKLARGNLTWATSRTDAPQPEFLEFLTSAFTDFASSARLVQDTRIKICAQGQAAMLEKFLGLPGIAETQETITSDFETKLRGLAEKFLAAPVPYDAKPAFLRFREALALSIGQPHVPLVAPARSPVV